MDSLKAERQALVDIGRRLSGRHMVAGGDGNISLRVDPDRILVTPAGCFLGGLAPVDLVLVSSDGEVLGDDLTPTSELPLHLAIYRTRADVGAVVHAHPPYATAFAVSGNTIDSATLPELRVFVGPIPLAPYATPGSDALARTIQPLVADHEAVLLKNHGLVTLGRTPEEAWRRHEIVEHGARILFLARQLGGIDKIPAEQLAALDELRARVSPPIPKLER